MITTEKTTIAIEALVNAPVEKVWEFWSDPKHIVRWNSASEDWHTTKAENDLREGGKFSCRMESRDGSQGFDFDGEYTKIEFRKLIEYRIADGRKVQIKFISRGDQTRIKEEFEAEQTNSLELQQSGWHSILDNFKRYVEASDKFEPMHFEILINEGPETVYRKMTDQKSYSQWTTEFNPTSHFTGSWDKGARIVFLGNDQNGGFGGMIGKIRENIPNRYICIEYTGMVENNKEILSGSKIEDWLGACERYFFQEKEGGTILSIDLDVNRNYASYFERTWPKALNRLKIICEDQT